LKAKRVFQFFILILALSGLVAVTWLLTQKSSPLYQPIENYELVAPLQQLSNNEVDQVITPYLGGSFWDISLDKIQAELTRLDWVESAKVRRKWPNLLYVEIAEQVPVARWNDNGLINGAGEVFFPNEITSFENLVMLVGSLDESTLILSQFIRLQDQLGELNMIVKKLSLAENVWRIEVLDGPEIIIDSDNFEAKVSRFIRAYSKLDKGLRNSARVYDLRYSNGFIVSN